MVQRAIGRRIAVCSVGPLTVCLVALLVVMLVMTAPSACAQPEDYARPPEPLPVFVPTPRDWEPKVPFPFDQTRDQVTQADINAMSEMCQWYNAQYDELIRGIDRFQFNRITPNGPGVTAGAGTDWDWTVGNLQEQADIVLRNIDQSVAFLDPRAQALVQARDFAGDVYFPIFEGESFYLLWQHLFNVGNGIRSHQANWVTGPSIQRVRLWGSRIHRSGVCEPPSATPESHVPDYSHGRPPP
jgi:hypothetical protein